MAVRAPAEANWLGRFVPAIVATLFGMAQAGIVVYFSSERSALVDLQKSVSATSEAVHMLKQEMDMNKARRDEQVNDITARLGRRR